MLEATVTLNLKRMLLTEAGLHHVEKHMEQELREGAESRELRAEGWSLER